MDFPNKVMVSPPVSAEDSSRTDEAGTAVRHSGRGVAGAVGSFRWVICALLLFGATKNYMDRQVLGVLKTTLQHDLGWNEIDYSNVVFAFQFAYAVGMLGIGRLIDRLGTRRGYSLAMIFWSLASMAHGIATWLGRVRSFPREYQVRCGMVSQEGARISGRYFQCGYQYRRNCDTADRALD